MMKFIDHVLLCTSTYNFILTCPSAWWCSSLCSVLLLPHTTLSSSVPAHSDVPPGVQAHTNLS